jgi:hypothetical protein
LLNLTIIQYRVKLSDKIRPHADCKRQHLAQKAG